MRSLCVWLVLAVVLSVLPDQAAEARRRRRVSTRKSGRRPVKRRRQPRRRYFRVSRDVIRELRKYNRSRSLAERTRIARRLARKVGVSALLRHLVHSEPHQRQPKRVQRVKVGRYFYHVVLPNNYSPRRSWPLHIALHGDGRVGAAKKLCFKYWRGDLARAGIILVCPSLGGPRPPWRSARGEDLVVSTFKDVQQRFNIRTDRVSLGGYSRGAIGAWTLGPKFVHLWSAISIRAGSPPWSAKLMRNLRYLPVYNIHGSRDPWVKVWGSRRAKQILKELRYEYVYREVPGAGHNFFPRYNRDVIKWLSRKRRRLLKHFHYHGDMTRPDRIVHWIAIDAAGKITLEAAIRRNVVRLKIENPNKIRRLTLYFNRRLVNLRRRVQVHLNGRLIIDRRVAERVDTVLESYRITGDLRRVFTAKVTWGPGRRRR